MRVGIVGVGQMGMPMLERLVGAGHDVTVRTRRPEPARDAEARGARAVERFDDREVVIICVYDDAQVRALGAQAVEELSAGATLVNHTTCSPTTVQDLAARGRARDVRVLDAALSGGPADVASGRLTLLVGGDPDALAGVRPVLAAYAEPIIPVGAVGDGQRIKLVNNALFGAQLHLVVEAERLLRDLGVEPTVGLAAIQHCSGDSYALRIAARAGSAARTLDGARRFIDKDLDTVASVAAELHVDLGRLARN